MRPSPAILKEMLTLDPYKGLLWWNFRDRRWFSSEGSWKSWNTKYAGTQAFTAVRDNGYLVGNLFGNNIRAHHIVWCMVYNEWPSEVDHIDGVRSNNGIFNLRLVDRQTNMRNSSLGKRNKSGVIGVYFDSRRGHWIASITVDRRFVYIGGYAQIEDAVKARKRAEIEHGFHSNHGKANVNHHCN